MSHSIANTIGTTPDAGYVRAGWTLELRDGSLLEVARIDVTDGGEVALFSSWGERWLFGMSEQVKRAA